MSLEVTGDGDAASCPSEDDRTETGKKLPRLIAVEFPGYVADSPEGREKVVEHLGGIKKISCSVFGLPMPTMSGDRGAVGTEKEQHLRLKWRKEDPFSKALLAEKTKSGGFLLRVRRRKNAASTVSSSAITTEVIGSIDGVYKFNSFGDYQMLPYDHRTGKTFIEDVRLGANNFTNFDLEIKETDMMFLPPSSFPKLDISYDQKFRPKRGEEVDMLHPKLRVPELQKLPGRHRFSLGTYRISYDEPIPHSPRDPPHVVFKRNPKMVELYNRVQKSFESRPIWSRNGIAAHEGLVPGDYDSTYGLKIVLPLISYYSMLGPWRNTWIRYGYDPKNHSEARIYQIVDIRIRKEVREKLGVPRKRGFGGMSIAEPGAYFPYQFKPGMVFRQRQSFFQYCDIDVPEMKEILALPVRESCDRADGFFPDGTNEKVRHLLVRYVLADAKKYADEKGAGDGGTGGLTVDLDDVQMDEDDDEEDEQEEFDDDQDMEVEV